MAVSSRKVQNKRDSNGVLTGKAGTVYDVNIKYTGQDGKKKSYAKKGFATKKEATQHEAEMKARNIEESEKEKQRNGAITAISFYSSALLFIAF